MADSQYHIVSLPDLVFDNSLVDQKLIEKSFGSLEDFI